jgi:hypothetical protein
VSNTEPPVETLRRAAEHMRSRAEAATPGPWARPLNTRNKAIVTASLPEGEQGAYISGTDPTTGERERCCVVLANTWSDGKHFRKRSGRDLEFIAAMHPAVALAVADWLDAEAAAHEGGMGVSDALRDLVAEVSTSEYDVQVAVSTLKQAVAVARAYLGEAS